MLDAVPIRVWLLVPLVLAALAPLRYVVRHLAHDPRRRDITQPPEDLSWRTPATLTRNLVILAALAAFAAFLLTPAAASLAQPRSFGPTLCLVMGALICGYTVLGFLDGRILPLSRGGFSTYERATQPKRFWASLSWNTLIGAGLVLGGFTGTTRWQNDPCFTLESSAETAPARIVACSALLGKSDSNTERRALSYAERGLGYDWLGEDRKAIDDYSQALRLMPRDGNTLYNRARVYARQGDPMRALADYDASLALWPDNAQTLINRG